VRFGTAGGRASAGTAFDREHVTIACDALEAGEHVEKRTHVRGLFLYPNDVAGAAVAGEFSGEFFFGKRIELLYKHDGGGCVFSLLALGAEFVADLAGADQDAVGLSDFGVGENVLEILLGEVGDGR
jgi:hypothetical protein